MLNPVPENIRFIFKVTYPRINDGIPEGEPKFDRYKSIIAKIDDLLEKTPEELRTQDAEHLASEDGQALTAFGIRTTKHNDYEYDFTTAKKIKTIFDQIKNFAEYGKLPNVNCAALFVERISHPRDYLDTLSKQLMTQVTEWQRQVEEIQRDVREHYKEIDELYAGRRTHPPSYTLRDPLSDISAVLGYAQGRIPITVEHCKQGVQYPKPPSLPKF